MARTSNLTDFLTDVSSAIKQKTGDSAPIPASEFDTEILSIETAGNYQSKTLSITQNGNYNLLPDQEFDAISNVNISVSVSPVLQNKTITENGSYTADQNYDGLGTVIVNVPSTGIDTSDATATVNDIISPKTAYVNGEKITGKINITEEPLDEHLIENTYITAEGLKTDWSFCITRNQELLLYLTENSIIVKNITSNTVIDTIDLVELSLGGFNMISVTIPDNDMNFYILLAQTTGTKIAWMKYNYNSKTISNINNTEASRTISYYSRPALIPFNAISNKFIYCNATGDNSKGFFDIIDIETGEKSSYITNSTWTIGFFLDKYDRFICLYDSTNTQVFYWFDSNITVEAMTEPFGYHSYRAFTYDETNTYYYNAKTKVLTLITVDTTNHTFNEIESTTIAIADLPPTSEIDLTIVVVLNKTFFGFDKGYIHTDKFGTITDVYYRNQVSETESRSSLYIAYENNMTFNNQWYVGSVVDQKIYLKGIANSGTRVLSANIYENELYNLDDATVTAEKVLIDEIAYTSTGKIIGTMPNNGELNYTPSKEEQIIPSGYTSGGKVTAVDITSLDDYERCESICDVIMGNSPLYTKVEYIESTGTQYIDTGLKGSNNTKITLRFCTFKLWFRRVYNRG